MASKVQPTPFTGSEWSRRLELVESIAMWTLGMVAFVIIVYGTVLVFQYSTQFLVLFLVAVVLGGVCVLVRALAHVGHLEVAVYLLLTVMLLLLTVCALMVEGIVLIASTFYVVVIAMAGIMLGSRASFIIAALAGMMYVLVAMLSRQPFLAPLSLSDNWTLALTSFISVLAFLFVAYLGMLTTRDLRRALRDATYDLVKANEELQEANRLKNRFLARVSHELRTPLNAIIGYTDMNLAGYYGGLNDAQRDALERVQRNGRQLLHLINDVLDLSRIDALGVELQSGDFSPRELVQSVVGTVEPRVQRKNLELTYEVDPSLPSTLVGDQVRLTQVLLNLVDNAIKFTDQGSIHLAAGNGGRNGDPKTWTLQVRDTGQGISERELAYIFEEFRQGASVYGKQADGVGLGLAIARRLVSAMGGEIRVQSRLGAGSTFTVVLPMAPVVQQEEERV
jgi:signal transduction histidine kinase